MDDNKKIIVESNTRGSVSINIPELHLKREWERKGAKKPITFGDLQQAIYDPGIQYMFEQGILTIDDMEAKIALGLEPEGATKPENIVVLTDSQMQRLLTVQPIHEFKKVIENLSYEQLQNLADFAIINEYSNIDKSDIIKKAIDVDVIRAIQLNRQNKEDDNQ